MIRLSFDTEKRRSLCHIVLRLQKKRRRFFRRNQCWIVAERRMLLS
ncbi:unnamed protein product [Oikopleura dioica]|uniref:Uncharacterized protein n=1 Tax=Oikopleura dioica TaxID=34765 RepID=E4Y224_OIKDI|nr:unnamed protein product [Oikopleura dioica]